MEGREILCDAQKTIDPDSKSTDFDDLPLDVARRVSLTRVLVQNSLAWLRFSIEKLPIKMTLSNLGALAVMMAIVLPRALTYILIYPIFRLVFGTLYPAYASYKAVRTKNVKEYVKWMMYWIVFALFTCAETFTDVFFSFWFPFYYEIKIILVLWLLSPATKGSSILYRRFVHPALTRREAEIDEALARATEQGYTAVLHLGTKGVNYATTVLMQTAIKNLPSVLPSPQGDLTGSQSESAISSLASPSSPGRLTTRESPRGDLTDGPSTRRTRPSGRRRRWTENDEMPMNAEPDLHNATTDDEEDDDLDEDLDRDVDPDYRYDDFGGDQSDPDRNEAIIALENFLKPPVRRSERARKTRKETSKKSKLSSIKADKRSDVEFSDEGGGGLVQQLRKSYSLSDLTGEKMDENRDTPDAQDETDMEAPLRFSLLNEPRLIPVEPRRRENVGRRGYSPRRTQSSSNRVEMYFSEVDVDVRQPRPRESIASLTNIRSSDDISSGYSSGEALQSHRATSQGDSLVRTSSVGARTRAKPRSVTKKTPEDAGEEKISDSKPPVQSFSLPSSRSPSISLTPEQAYEILLMLSQCPDPNELLKLMDRLSGKTSEKDEFVEPESESMSRESSEEFVDVSGNVNLEPAENSLNKSIPIVSAEVKEIMEVIEPFAKTDENKIDVETKIEPVKAESTMDKVASEFDKNMIIQLETEPFPISSITDAKEPVVTSTKHVSTLDQKDQEKDSNVSKASSADIDVKKITGEICQEKFDELKQLLNTAHQAVSSIVSAQDKLSKPEEIEAIDEDSRNISNVNSSEVVPNSSISQANSEDIARAGKYHKKPAPKAPNVESQENSDHEDTESQNALKATLVIKTGTLKTFSNSDTTKDVFFAHAQETKKKKKSARTRTKEGFSKLLTIPKNIFHNAFHKDQSDTSVKGDDSTSIVSEASGSKSRSVSVGSRDVFLDADSKEFGQENELKNIESSSDRNNDENKDEAYISLHPNDSEQASLNPEKSDKGMDQIVSEEKKEVATVGINGTVPREDKDNVAKSEPMTPQLLHEPRVRRETITDIF